MLRNTILLGDALEVLKGLPTASCQCCVTSPPYYGLRSYLDSEHPDKMLEIGLEVTPQEYIRRLVEVFREVRRVLRLDGVLWLNLGDSYVGYKGKKYNQNQQRGTGEYSPMPRGYDVGSPHTAGLLGRSSHDASQA